MLALLAGNAVALATLQGGGSSVASSPPSPPSSMATVPVASGDTTTVPSSAPAQGAPSSRAASQTTTTEAPSFGDQMPVMSEGWDYELTVTPECVRPGEPITAVMRLPAKRSTGGVFMAFYADGSFEQGLAGVTAPDGTITYTWVARPVPGEGRLMTQGADSETGEKGTKIVAFRVAPVGGSC